MHWHCASEHAPKYIEASVAAARLSGEFLIDPGKILRREKQSVTIQVSALRPCFSATSANCTEKPEVMVIETNKHGCRFSRRHTGESFRLH